MGLLSRFTTYLKSLSSAALDQAEDPSITLDYAYQQQLDQLQNLRRAIVDVVTNEKRLELQKTQVQTLITRYEDQARQALAADREDLARLALERRQNLQGEITTLQRQIEDLKAQQEKFVQLEQRLSTRVEAFRTQKDLTKAQYGAAEAQVKISKSAMGLSEEMGDISLAVQRAQDKVQTMKARAQAMDQLIEQGTLPEIGQLGPGGDQVDCQLAQIANQASIDVQLAALKQQIQLASGQHSPDHPPLPSGQKSNKEGRP